MNVLSVISRLIAGVGEGVLGAYGHRDESSGRRLALGIPDGEPCDQPLGGRRKAANSCV